MAGYIGTRCMVCSEKFTEEDDIVVCPECGTPYHKECYKKEEKCVNTVLHENGGSWKPSYDTGSDGGMESESVVCRFCGYANPPLTIFCHKCGMPAQSLQEINAENIMNEQRYNGASINSDPNAYNGNAGSGMPFNPFLINFSDPLCGFNPDEDFDGVKMSELGDFVGTNTHYYLPIFKRFKEGGRLLTWNFSAMLVPELYFSYRKMPLYALAALIMRFISMVPQFIFLFAQFPGAGALYEFASRFDFKGAAFQGLLMLCSAMVYALMFTAGLFGNKLYYGHTLKKRRKIKEYSNGAASIHILNKKGGTSGLWLSIFICLMALPTYILLFGPALTFKF